MALPRVLDIPRFVGRERELAALATRLDVALAGRGGVALIAGEPGIGKTRLAEELAGRARRRGAVVLWGRCHEGGGAPAFWPWSQIVRALLRDRDAQDVRETLGPSAPEIAQLVPEVRELLSGLPEPSVAAPDQARFRLSVAATAVLSAAARARPLVVILDDLQWWDAPSLLLLCFLAREIADARVLVLATYRNDALRGGHPLQEAIAALARVPRCDRLNLGGLDEPEIARMIAATTGAVPPTAVVSTVRRRTDGNPFFVTEVARVLGEGGPDGRPDEDAWCVVIPPTVLDAVQARLGRLSEGCQHLLTVAAVVGRVFNLGALGCAPGGRRSRSGGDRMLSLLEEAERAQIIVGVADRPGRFRFVHDLVREALHAALPVSRRVLLHRRIGAALEGLSGGDAEAHLEELAHHFFEAVPGGDVEKAIAYAARAGRRAAMRGAPEEGARFFDMALRALEMLPGPTAERRYELLMQRGGAEVRAGRPDAARESFGGAAALARRNHALRPCAQTAERLARAALGPDLSGLTHGVVDWRGVRLLEEALAAVGDGDRALRARLLARLGMELYYAEDRARSTALSQEAVRLARSAADPAALAFTLQARRWVAWGPDTIAERLALGAELVELAPRLEDRELALAGHHTRFVALQELGEMEVVAEEAERQARLADELRTPYYQWHVTVYRAMRAVLDGRFDEGESLAGRAFTFGQRAEAPNAEQILALQRIFLRRQQGQPAEAEATVRRAVGQYPTLVVWRCALAVLACETDQREEARRLFEQVARDGFAGLPRDLFWLGNVALLSETCAQLGDRERAATLHALLAPYATLNVMIGRAVCLGSAARYLGLLAATRGDRTAAARHFDDALTANVRMGAQPLVACTQYDYAAMLLGHPASAAHALRSRQTWSAEQARTDRRRARELLEEALATAQALGMAGLADRGERLRSATPADGHEVAQDSACRAPRAARPAGLTAREATVLGLLASGRSNPEIAATLVLSVKTVERHTVNLYAKIGARNRVDAAAYALRHGLA
jgi:DNA-binding CsgD family transcriptional regulator